MLGGRKMELKIDSQKGFGDILGLALGISKQKFSEFLWILLIFLGPIYVLQAVLEWGAGVPFFKDVQTGAAWFEQFIGEAEETYSGADAALGITGLLSLLFAPVATAAILFAINHMRKGEDYTVGSVVKAAFSRFWPMLGSNLLFALMVGGLFFLPVMLAVFIGAVGAFISPAGGIAFAVFLFLAFAFGIGLLLTRWSFYYASVVFREGAPGFTRSWHLTKGRLWPTFWLYVVLFLIITIFTIALEMLFGFLLGNSVLRSLIVNAGTILTSLFGTVVYAVMYFDLKARHAGDV
jgi:hypothetical protein